MHNNSSAISQAFEEPCYHLCEDLSWIEIYKFFIKNYQNYKEEYEFIACRLLLRYVMWLIWEWACRSICNMEALTKTRVNAILTAIILGYFGLMPFWHPQLWFFQTSFILVMSLALMFSEFIPLIFVSYSAIILSFFVELFGVLATKCVYWSKKPPYWHF